MADSALPVGGFAYSYGLETAIRQGLLAGKIGLDQYLTTYAEQVISFDFPFVHAAYQCAYEASNIAPIAFLLGDYEAMLLNPAVRKAGTVIGKNWLRLFGQLHQESEPIRQLENTFAHHGLATDYPIVFGLCMQLSATNLQDMLHAYFYMALRDQISALIRLGVVGPTWAHAHLHHLLERFQPLVAQYQPIPYQEAYKSAYLLEIAQLAHERVYSKLFQN